MNWYKKIKLAYKVKVAEVTLYHGTSINNYDSIKQLGLIPMKGDFVSDAYSEHEAAGIELPELVFAADKGKLTSAVTAMIMAISRMLGKRGYHSVSLNDIRNYGILAIMKGNPGAKVPPSPFNHREEDDKDWNDGMYDNDFPTVEPSDYFSEDVVKPDIILMGNKLIDFLTRNGQLGDNYTKTKQLINWGIAEAIQNNPNLDRQYIANMVKQKVDKLTYEEFYSYYSNYKRRFQKDENVELV